MLVWSNLFDIVLKSHPLKTNIVGCVCLRSCNLMYLKLCLFINLFQANLKVVGIKAKAENKKIEGEMVNISIKQLVIKRLLLEEDNIKL